jgi:hypothetical protein
MLIKKQRYYCAKSHVKKKYNYVINCIKPRIYTDTDTEAIVVRPKPTSLDKTDFHHSKLFQSVQNRHPPYWAKTNFLPSKSFLSSQNQRPPFQAIPAGPKPTSSTPSHYSWAKIYFPYSEPFQSDQKRLSLFQAITVYGQYC